MNLSLKAAIFTDDDQKIIEMETFFVIFHG